MLSVPSVTDFDERIQVCCKIQQDIADQPQEKCSAMDPVPWNESTRESLVGLKNKIDVCVMCTSVLSLCSTEI